MTTERGSNHNFGYTYDNLHTTGPITIDGVIVGLSYDIGRSNMKYL